MRGKLLQGIETAKRLVAQKFFHTYVVDALLHIEEYELAERVCNEREIASRENFFREKIASIKIHSVVSIFEVIVNEKIPKVRGPSQEKNSSKGKLLQGKFLQRKIASSFGSDRHKTKVLRLVAPLGFRTVVCTQLYLCLLHLGYLQVGFYTHR